MKLYFYVESPHQWALLDRRKEVVETGICDELVDLPVPKKVTELVGVVPADLVTTHRVAIPARSRAKANAAIPFLLEESLATDVEDLLFTLLEFRSGEEAVVAVTERRNLEKWRNEFMVLAADVGALVPEQLMLPRHPQARYTLAKKKNNTFVVRHGDYEGLAMDADALGVWWDSLANPHAAVAVNDIESAKYLVAHGGELISEWEFGRDFSEWLLHSQTATERIDLLQGSDKSQQSTTSSATLKVACVLLLLALGGRIGMDGYDYYRLSKQRTDLDRQIVQLFRSTFPDVGRIVNPRLQMEQRIDALKTGTVGAGQFQLLLSAVALAVPKSTAILEEIAFRDNALVITCTTNDFAGLDRLKKRFELDKRIRAELISSGSRDTRVSGRFKLDRV